ncbi:MAG: hypothetical protein ACRCSP_06180 [Rhodoglobus sp.]
MIRLAHTITTKVNPINIPTPPEWRDELVLVARPAHVIARPLSIPTAATIMTILIARLRFDDVIIV